MSGASCGFWRWIRKFRYLLIGLLVTLLVTFVCWWLTDDVVVFTVMVLFAGVRWLLM